MLCGGWNPIRVAKDAGGIFCYSNWFTVFDFTLKTLKALLYIKLASNEV